MVYPNHIVIVCSLLYFHIHLPKEQNVCTYLVYCFNPYYLSLQQYFCGRLVGIINTSLLYRYFTFVEQTGCYKGHSITDVIYGSNWYVDYRP